MQGESIILEPILFKSEVGQAIKFIKHPKSPRCGNIMAEFSQQINNNICNYTLHKKTQLQSFETTVPTEPYGTTQILEEQIGFMLHI